MAGIYTYENLEDDVDGMIHDRINNLKDKRKTLNRAVRFVIGDTDLRSTKRKSSLSPNLFNDIYDYACPTDLKAINIIDIIPQINRSKDLDWELVTEEEFDRTKNSNKFMVAFKDSDFVRKLRVSVNVDDDELVISELDGLTSGGGTWKRYGDGENLTKDSDNYVKGAAAINWDIDDAGGLTAGIYNDDLDEFDLTDYIAAGSIFVWVYITSITDLTNFILMIGNDASNNLQKTITAVNEGTAFVAGWNLLRFDLFTATENGTLVSETCKFVRLYMTKLGTKISETDYRFDWLVAKRGKIHDVLYYSKYGWQTAAGIYIENSTADTDLLNVDTEELELITIKAAEYASQELRDYDDVKYFMGLYSNSQKTGKKDEYIFKWPSEAKLLITKYYNI